MKTIERRFQQLLSVGVDWAVSLRTYWESYIQLLQFHFPVPAFMLRAIARTSIDQPETPIDSHGVRIIRISVETRGTKSRSRAGHSGPTRFISVFSESGASADINGHQRHAADDGAVIVARAEGPAYPS